MTTANKLHMKTGSTKTNILTLNSISGIRRTLSTIWLVIAAWSWPLTGRKHEVKEKELSNLCTDMVIASITTHSWPTCFPSMDMKSVASINRDLATVKEREASSKDWMILKTTWTHSKPGTIKLIMKNWRLFTCSETLLEVLSQVSWRPRNELTSEAFVLLFHSLVYMHNQMSTTTGGWAHSISKWPLKVRRSTCKSGTAIL